MNGVSRPTLSELEEEVRWFDESTPEKDVLRFIENAKTAPSTTSAMDRKRIDLQIEALKVLYQRDGRTGPVAKSIIFNDDASLGQKWRAFRIWFGR